MSILLCSCGAYTEDNSSNRKRFFRRHPNTVAHLESVAEMIRAAGKAKSLKKEEAERLKRIELELYRRRHPNG